MRRQNIPRIEIKPGEFMRAPAAQQFKYTQLDGFGDAPRKYAFAAYTIFKLLLSLKQQDARSMLRHRSGKAGAAQTSAYHNQIELLRHLRLQSSQGL
jgi:hypothetical protein